MDFAWKHVDTFTTACAIYGIDWDTAPVDGMVLDCDSVTVDTGVLGDYHIEWKLGSPTQAATTVFTSGITADLGEVQMQHPFSDPQPVQSGVLYPVFKYIIINGNTYSAYPDEVGAEWSPDLLICLPPVTITPITCSTSYGGDPIYQFKWVYINTTDGGLNKSRTFTYERCPNLFYLAWELRAYSVAEQIQLYYCTDYDDPGTLIDNFIIGSNYVTVNLLPVNYPTNPRYYNWINNSNNAVKFITDLSDYPYIVGDFVKIIITGSILEPTVTNTNWDLKLQYLTDTDLDYSMANTDLHKIASTPVMDYVTDPTCAYRVRYNTIGPDTADHFNKNSASAYFLVKYTMLYSLVTGYPLSTYIYDPVIISNEWKIRYSTQYIWGAGVYTCENLGVGETISISKDASSMTYTFSHDNAYNQYKANITSIQADPDYTTALGLPNTDPRYYATYRVGYWVADSCGDTRTQYYHDYHLTSVITYDDLNKTINFTFVTLTNPVADADCDQTYDAIKAMIDLMAYTKNFTITSANDHSHITTQDSVGMVWAYTFISSYTVSPLVNPYIYVEKVMLNGFGDSALLANGFWETLFTAARGNYYILYRAYDRVTLTDTTDHASRLANWKLERSIAMRTDNIADLATLETVYETP